jgi:hypothetical protein
MPPDPTFEEAYRAYLRTVKAAWRDVDVDSVRIPRPGEFLGFCLPCFIVMCWFCSDPPFRLPSRPTGDEDSPG